MTRICLTGSYVYGPVTKKSDLDIVVYEQDAEFIKTFLHQKNIEFYYVNSEKEEDYPEEVSSFYFEVSGLPRINIIVVTSQVEMDSWIHATKEMVAIPVIEDRSVRLSFFHALLYSLSPKK